MTDLRTAAQQALEALEYADACLKKQLTTKTKHEYAQDLLFAAGTALRAALAEPVQKPIGYLWPTGRHPEFRFTQQKRDGVDGTPVYTTPPQRKPLTRDEAMQLVNETAGAHWCDEAHLQRFRAAIERAHGIGE